MPDDSQQSSGFGATLKSKWGPLPVWGWLLIVTALALGYYLWSRRSSAQQPQAQTASPGVVVINQGDLPPGTKPPAPAEDHDKDDKDKHKGGHDDDDHHRHRKRHHHDAAAAAAASGPSGSAIMPTGRAPGPPNVGLQFPVISPPSAGEGGSAAGEGSGGAL